MHAQNHRRKNRISTIDDADDRQYLSIPVMVTWGPGRLTLVRLKKRWRIGNLFLPMWRKMPESHLVLMDFNLSVTSAFIKPLRYLDVRRCTGSRSRSSRDMLSSTI